MVSDITSDSADARGLAEWGTTVSGQSSLGSSNEDGTLDFVGVVLRHPIIISLSMLMALGLGFLHYTKTPPIYESHVDILVEAKQSPVFTAESMMEQKTGDQKHIATHTYSLTSPVIVERALRRLGPLPSLADQSNPVATVVNSLSVEVVADNSDVLSLSCLSPSRKDCYEIVGAVVESYEEFLGEMSKDVGKETTSLIREAKDDLMEQLREHEGKYREFQQTAPLIWHDGKGVNPHHERQLQVEEARAKLAIERADAKSQLEGIANTLARPNGRRVLYFEALKELASLDKGTGAVAANQVIDRENARILADQLHGLIAEENRLSEEFGRGHPTLMAVRRRIRTVRQQLTSTDGELTNMSSENESPEKVSEYITVYATMVSDRLDKIDRQLRELDRVFDGEQDDAMAMQAFVVQDEALQKDMLRTQQLFEAVVARLNEINIIRDHGSERMRVMAAPELGRQVSPNLVKILGLAGVLGGMAGFGLAYLLDVTQASFNSPDEIRTLLQRPIVGMIPQLPPKSLTVRPGMESLAPILVAAHRNNSNAAEAFRAVRTSLFFSMQGRSHQVVQVTSPLPSDGKSTLAANLAITIAQAGKRVLLVDADFRRPSQHLLFGRPKYSQYGLAEVVRGEIDPAEEDLVTEVENLFVMTCGARPDNPSELLTSADFVAAIDILRKQYDLIILDSPPVLAVTDPAAIAAKVDGVLLALRLRRGSRVSATRAIEVLNDVDANVLGVIVNAASISHSRVN